MPHLQVGVGLGESRFTRLRFLGMIGGSFDIRGFELLSALFDSFDIKGSDFKWVQTAGQWSTNHFSSNRTERWRPSCESV